MEKLDLSQLDNEEKALEIRYVVAKYIRYWPWYILFIFVFVFATYIFHRYTVDEFEVTGSLVIKNSSTPEPEFWIDPIFSTMASISKMTS